MTDEYARVEAELNARGYTRMVFDLSRIEALLDLLGSPQRAYPAIHLTGTNGKTSTARMVESLLRAHGLRTGLYTSPHLETVRERITVDGQPISEERFVEVYGEVAPVAAFLDERGDHDDRPGRVRRRAGRHRGGRGRAGRGRGLDQRPAGRHLRDHADRPGPH